MPRRLLVVKEHFDAAHWIEGYDGECRNLHGHRWDVEFIFEGRELSQLNMLVDFKHIKQALKAILPDHSCLNDEFGPCPTAELLAEKLCERYNNIQPNEELKLISVEVFESPECSALYIPD